MTNSHPLTERGCQQLDAHWRALNYLAAGQLYLTGNPLLRTELRPEHVKPRLLGHWGTCPGLGLVYTHLNRVITERGQQTVCVWGPGHGAAAVLAGAWLEGTFGELNPDAARDEAGMGHLFHQFSHPGGLGSHTGPAVPGSLQEGGELGHSLSHAYGAAYDNPDLLSVCVIGDGEAETGPLAAAWHSNKFLDPVHDGAVLPVLHLNGYKIANPAVLSRIPEEELAGLLRGYGHDPLFVTATPDSDPGEVHRAMAGAMDTALDRIRALQQAARAEGDRTRPRWPAIVLRTPKGWTGPRAVDGQPVEDTWRSHQIPLSGVRDDPKRLAELEGWLRSYRPHELFDAAGRPHPEVTAWVPDGELRLGANPHANGGRLRRTLPLPDLADHAVPAGEPGAGSHEPTRVLGGLLRDVLAATEDRRDFRVLSPDEMDSNHLGAVYEVTERAWQGGSRDSDEHLGHHGRAMEVLSEHLCQGWLEGYVLTGRHGVFATYEAFAGVVADMATQYAKWLHSAREVPWRAPVASFTYLLTSHAWRQDHNGFSHQDPGFVDHVLTKSPEVVRVYLPPDANTTLCVADRVLRSTDVLNLVVAGKQTRFDWLGLEDARDHTARGAGIWEWAGTETGEREPDVVLACAGDVPTEETLAAASLLRRWLPGLAVRVVNVVDLARLMPADRHPHGMTGTEFGSLFTEERPVVFAYHGYPWLIHRLTHGRDAHERFHVHGYRESGATTTPFDMLVRNGMDRYRLVMDVIDRVPGLAARAGTVRQAMADVRNRHHDWVRAHGTDLPEVTGWRWSDTKV
ncbi:phosphoketolase family protein [Streptomyces sp. TRM 70351]|uniref:phosphoketolase family protein n=1 Tax=Streptomyces sp. TRM 70351 TaxID=3116552 RepID=UPI002E7C1FB4|nr:phosphoketolase family protein [Streptomyces sp. TRM 70351]MEE1927275.1 phosphoketolase family protein [Streptomyces sp. TRM 70351]